MSVLDGRLARIVSFEICWDKKLCVAEEQCDHYFREQLTRAEMFQLAEEIKAIAEGMAD